MITWFFTNVGLEISTIEFSSVTLFPFFPMPQPSCLNHLAKVPLSSQNNARGARSHPVYNRNDIWGRKLRVRNRRTVTRVLASTRYFGLTSLITVIIHVNSATILLISHLFHTLVIVAFPCFTTVPVNNTHLLTLQFFNKSMVYRPAWVDHNLGWLETRFWVELGICILIVYNGQIDILTLSLIETWLLFSTAGEIWRDARARGRVIWRNLLLVPNYHIAISQEFFFYFIVTCSNIVYLAAFYTYIYGRLQTRFVMVSNVFCRLAYK